MNELPKAHFNVAITESLAYLKSKVWNLTVPHQVWRKDCDFQWHAEIQPRPDLASIFASVDSLIEASSETFCRSFPVCHPEHAGMVGLSISQLNWGTNLSYVVRSALGELWDRHHTFDVTDGQVEQLVQELSDFVDNPTVRLRFRARLINFDMKHDSIQLADGLTIRRQTVKEINGFYGGPVGRIGFRPQFIGIDEFIVEGELDEPKVLGDRETSPRLWDRVNPKLESVNLALRTFKEGSVGYGYVDFVPVRFCPVPIPSLISGSEFIPVGHYSLSETELGEFVSHAKLISHCSEPAMRLACSRLADAEIRTRPQDRIVDAVIGMEALLLAGIQDGKSEIGFKFSLNYSMLFPIEQRRPAYRLARDLYNLRSRIAHGSRLDESKLKLDGESLSLRSVGQRATTSLRKLISMFLNDGTVHYTSSEYWLDRYFGGVQYDEVVATNGAVQGADTRRRRRRLRAEQRR